MSTVHIRHVAISVCTHLRVADLRYPSIPQKMHPSILSRRSVRGHHSQEREKDSKESIERDGEGGGQSGFDRGRIPPPPAGSFQSILIIIS